MFCIKCGSKLQAGSAFCHTCGSQLNNTQILNVETTAQVDSEQVNQTQFVQKDCKALLRRAFLFIEDRDFVQANTLLNEILNTEPENAMAYLGLLCVELHVNGESELSQYNVPIEQYNNYQKALRFGDEQLRNRLSGYNRDIIDRNTAAVKHSYYMQYVNSYNQVVSAATVTSWQCKQSVAIFSDLAKRFKEFGEYEYAVSYAEDCDKRVNELSALEEQFRDKEKAKKKGNRKVVGITLLSVFVFIAGALALLLYRPYSIYKASTESAAVLDEIESLILSYEYEEALALYVQYVNYKSTMDSQYTKEDGVREQLSAQALIMLAEGDLDGGNALFTEGVDGVVASNDVVPHSIALHLWARIIPRRVEEFVIHDSAAYWVNSDGTLSTACGRVDVSRFSNVSRLSFFNGYPAVLTRDKELIYYTNGGWRTVKSVKEFTIYEGNLAVIYDKESWLYDNDISDEEYVLIIEKLSDELETQLEQMYEGSEELSEEELAILDARAWNLFSDMFKPYIWQEVEWLEIGENTSVYSGVGFEVQWTTDVEGTYSGCNAIRFAVNPKDDSVYLAGKFTTRYTDRIYEDVHSTGFYTETVERSDYVVGRRPSGANAHEYEGHIWRVTGGMVYTRRWEEVQPYTITPSEDIWSNVKEYTLAVQGGILTFSRQFGSYGDWKVD